MLYQKGAQEEAAIRLLPVLPFQSMSILKNWLCNRIISVIRILQDSYSDNAPDVIGRLVSDIHKTGGPLLKRPTGWFTSGAAIGKALRSSATADGIRYIEDVMITDVLKSGDIACGAVGIDVFSGEIIIFRAKAVVLASGGFQPFSFKSTSSDMTGDGPGAAFRAGCRLADMEFHLFIPTVLSPSYRRGSIFPFIIYMADILNISIENALFSEFMSSVPKDILSLAEGSKWSKMIFAYYWQKEVLEGRGSPGGGIYFKILNRPFFKTKLGLIKAQILLKKIYGNKWKYQGDNFDDIPEMVKCGGIWEIGLSSEYSNGGIFVFPDMSTDVSGLFAAGECASGTFGALRIYEGLTEMLVQGQTAGNSAVAFASGHSSLEPDEDSLLYAINRINMYSVSSDKSSDDTVFSLTSDLQDAADNGIGLYKNETAIMSSLKDVQIIKHKLDDGIKIINRYGYRLEIIKGIQLENLLICTETALNAALLRKESRGMHIRSDYPEVDNINHLCRYTFEKTAKGFKTGTIKPDFVFFKPQIRKYDNLMSYALECEKVRSRK